MKNWCFTTLLISIVLSSITFSSALGTQFINLKINMINDDFGTADLSHFIIFLNGDAINNQDFISPNEAVIPIAPGPFNINEYSKAVGYIVNYSGCSGTLALGENATCIITNDDPEILLPTGQLCYQESANQATSCGGLGTGAYYLVNYTSNKYNDFWKDGIWVQNATLTAAGCITSYGPSAQAGEYYVNYSKPVGALSSSVFKLKEFYGLSADAEAITDNTYSIPEGCFNQQKLSFRIILPLAPLNFCGAGPVEFIASCWNGQDWQQIRYTNSTDWAGIFEEAMIWGINTTNTNQTEENQTENNESGEARAYYGNGWALSASDDKGHLIQALWIRSNNSQDLSGGVLQIGTADNAEKFKLIKKDSPKNAIFFDVFLYTEKDKDILKGISKSIGAFELTRTPKSDVILWDGKLIVDTGKYQGNYDIKIGTRSIRFTDIQRVYLLVKETQEFNPRQNFIKNLIKKILINLL